MNIKRLIVIILTFCFKTGYAQMPPVFDAATAQNITRETPTRHFLSPKRIVWKSHNEKTYIENESTLFKPGNGQADLSGSNICVLKSDKAAKPGLLFDFGKELQGGVQIVTGMSKSGKPVKIRVRFGESASEAMSNIDSVKGATNDHAMRDFIIEVPWLGKMEVGNTGFRFVRLDIIEEDEELKLQEVRAVLRSGKYHIWAVFVRVMNYSIKSG
jgi:alpha-L-rhamnosidase